MEIMITIAIA
ncbi:hypothetical protein LP420_37445 [Massilia sp. B-10]|nr:hypothetical protein LP420_37445 [Massilia sp. B-10]UUZ57386.1 hypothetical protein LP419_36910 [Massilia sp. H-1]